MRIAIYPEVVEALGDSFLSDAITPGDRSKLPTLELAPPLRWATDEEVPLQMEVQYADLSYNEAVGSWR